MFAYAGVAPAEGAPRKMTGLSREAEKQSECTTLWQEE